MGVGKPDCRARRARGSMRWGRGLIPLQCWFALLAVVAFAGLARGADDARSGSAVAVEPYRSGPLSSRHAASLPELSDGVEECLGLSLIGLVLYGLRASGLSRAAERP